MSEAKEPWWRSIFAPSKKATAAGAPTYRELVSQVAELENLLAAQGRSLSQVRYRLGTTSRDASEQIARMQAALEWYADLAHWRPRGLLHAGQETPSIQAHEDRGRRARKALGRA